MSKSLTQKLLEVQRKVDKLTKSSSNPHFKSKYADLNEVLEVSKQALNEEGLFIAQPPGKDEFGQYVETSLIDSETAQSIVSRVYFSGNEDNMQKIGAAITYARRFGLKSILAMEDSDDDGETAVGRGQRVSTPTTSAPKANDGGGTKAVSFPASTPVKNDQSRKTLLEKISLTSQVVIAQKKATQEDVVALLAVFGVKAKEELNDDQARKLLVNLEEKLK